MTTASPMNENLSCPHCGQHMPGWKFYGSVTADVKTVSEANRRGSWRAHHPRTQLQRQTVGMLMRGLRIPKTGVLVRLTRIAPQKLDRDNLASALKACRDGVADWLGIDDRESERLMWVVAQEKGRVREYAVRIDVFVTKK